MDQKTKTKENLRKASHVLLGCTFLLLIFFDILDQSSTLLFLIVLLIGFTLSIVEKQKRLGFFSQLLDRLERDSVRRRLPGEGLLFFVFGVGIVLSLFEKNIALASVAILTFADPVTHYFGVRWGKITHPLTDRKFLEGTVAGFIVGTLSALFFVPLLQALVGAFVAMIVEALEIRYKWLRFDDNAIIPIVAATSMVLVGMIFG